MSDLNEVTSAADSWTGDPVMKAHLDKHGVFDEAERLIAREDADRLAYLDSLRPVCPTCGGDCCVDAVTEHDLVHPDMTGPRGEPLIPCPDCTYGHMSWERIANLAVAVHTDRHNLGHGWKSCLDHLRSVK